MTRELSFDQLAITLPMVLQAMGYGDFQPEQHIIALTEELLAEANRLVCASYCVEFFNGSPDGELVRMGDTMLHPGATIVKSLKGSSRFALFTATAGGAFQQWCTQLEKEDDMLVRFVVDSIGTEIAEAATNRMQQWVGEQCAADGVRHTNRYSPGYCGWSLTNQRQLFSMLGGSPCGITLNDSCLMYPIKSVSGIIGIGEQVKFNNYGCALCDFPNCFRRKQR